MEQRVRYKTEPQKKLWLKWTNRAFGRGLFDATCGKEPIEGDNVTSVIVRDSDVSHGVTLKRFESLYGYYGRKKKGLPFNPCVHQTYSRKSTDSKPVKLEKWFYSPPFELDEWDGTCYSFRYWQLYSFQTLELELEDPDCSMVTLDGIETAASIEGAEVVITDPYLLLNDNWDTKVAQLTRIAMDNLVPKLEGEFNAPVFIAELTDLKSLALSVIDTIRFLPEQILRLFSKPLGTLSGRYLEGIFGYLPLVSDVKAAVNTGFEVGDKVIEFLEGQNKRQTLHFQKALSPETFREPGWFSSNIVAQWDSTEFGSPHAFMAGVIDSITCSGHIERSVEVDFHATLEFEYRLPALNAFWQSMFGELDTWGINLSPAVIWEKIPFSFAVDWCFNVGSWLKRFDKKNLPVQVVIYDYCWSIKYQLTEETFIDQLEDLRWSNRPLMNDAPGWTPPVLPVKTQVYTGYYRSVGIPTVPPESLWSLPSSWQIITAAALGIQLTGERFDVNVFSLVKTIRQVLAKRAGKKMS